MSNIYVLHQALVDRLKQARFIRTPRIEAAFRAVPRHLFLPDTTGVGLEMILGVFNARARSLSIVPVGEIVGTEQRLGQ